MKNREEMFTEVRKIFQEVFDDEHLEVNAQTTARDVEDWDSLAQINLWVAMEKRFNIKFNIGEITGLQNVGEMMDLIEKKVNG